jgi:hypothetical protein
LVLCKQTQRKAGFETTRNKSLRHGVAHPWLAFFANHRCARS